MVHDSRSAARKADQAPPRLAIRLVSRRASSVRRSETSRPRTLLPVIGPDDVILPTFDETLATFAIRAQEGDQDARDALYFAFLPKLERLMLAVRVPSVPDDAEGPWSRDDVAQEGYLVFIELVDDWAGDVSFTAFVLSRFTWRLKDAMRRGMARPSVPPRQRSVPVEAAIPLGDHRDDLPDEALPVLATVMAALPEPLDTVLFEVVQGKSKSAIAREMGVSRRTMVRYWQRVRARVMEVLAAMDVDVP